MHVCLDDVRSPCGLCVCFFVCEKRIRHLYAIRFLVLRETAAAVGKQRSDFLTPSQASSYPVFVSRQEVYGEEGVNESMKNALESVIHDVSWQKKDTACQPPNNLTLLMRLGNCISNHLLFPISFRVLF